MGKGGGFIKTLLSINILNKVDFILILSMPLSIVLGN